MVGGPMRYFTAVLLVAVLSSAAMADDAASVDQAAKSALLSDGPLSAVREPLSRIFQFAIEGGQLKIDREAWDRAVKEDAKKGKGEGAEANPFGDGAILVNPIPRNAGGGAGNAFGANPLPARILIGGIDANSSLETLFSQIQQAALSGSRGRSTGS